MTVEEIRQMAKDVIENKIHPNYQHNGKSYDEIDALALKSYSRLSAEQQTKVITIGVEYKILKDPNDSKNMKELIRWRFLCQTNLFFLCKVLEKYKDVSLKTYVLKPGDPGSQFGSSGVHNTHEEICNEFFVRKDPTVKTFKQFALDYIEPKERLLLVPRGGFKSSIDMADCVQWIICFPEVTMLILTGVLDLAKDFVKETKDHFTLADGGTEAVNLFETKKATKARVLGDGNPSMFQILFPEHCIPENDGRVYEFKSPASPEACTLFASAIDQNLSGWHVGIMKLDDVVTNENSRTPERLTAVNRQVHINNAMLHPYGFNDKIGTWYDSNDTYGQDMKFIERCIKEGEAVKKKVYLRSAWWPNEEAKKAGKVDSEMKESDWVLWFNEPGQLTYEFLRYKKLEDPEYFPIKYLNDPTQVRRIRFPRELMIRRTLQARQLPQQGMIVTTVDTAYSTKNWADYTVIMTSLIYGGRFYIIDMKRGRYNEYELPQLIAATALQWKPKHICIEDSVGVKWLGKEIYREMDKLRIRTPIRFVPLGQGSKANAKDQKAKPVLRYLGDERLLFSNTCVGLDEIYNELEKFGTASATHDDIVSALSILVDQFASYADMEGKMTASSPAFVSDQQAKQAYDTVYGGETFSKLYTQKNWAAAQEAMAADPTLSLTEAAKVSQQSKVESMDYDPLGELWQ